MSWISFHKKERRFVCACVCDFCWFWLRFGFGLCACVLAYLPDLEVVFQAKASQFNWGRSLYCNLQTRWKWNLFNDSFPKNRWNRGMLTLLYFCQRLPTLRGNKLFSWWKSAEQTLKELKGYSQSWYTCFSLYLLPQSNAFPLTPCPQERKKKRGGGKTGWIKTVVRGIGGSWELAGVLVFCNLICHVTRARQ